MHRIFAYSAFGWLALSGMLHFIVDVVSQHVLGKREPGLETTLYYGLHTAYAAGQVLFGLLALSVTRRAPRLLGQWPVKALCIAAFLAWGAICLTSIEYWQPAATLTIFGLLLALALTLSSKDPPSRPSNHS